MNTDFKTKKFTGIGRINEYLINRFYSAHPIHLVKISVFICVHLWLKFPDFE